MRDAPGLPFTLTEFGKRLAKLRSSMAEQGIDACLISVPENIYYLTGFTTTGYYMFGLLIVPRDGEPAVVTYLEERINIVRRSWLERYFNYSVTDDPIEVAAGAIRDLGLENKALGCEDTSPFLPVSVYQKLVASLPNARWTSCGGLVEEARLVKSEAEVGYIRQAAAAAVEGMTAALAAAADRTTENHIAAEVYRATILAGSEYPGSPPYVATGERSGLPHGTWEGRQLQDGDIIFLEHSGCVRRYSAAMMRTAFLGSPPDIVRSTAEAVLLGLSEAIAAIRPGATSGEVDRACRDAIRRQGMPDYTHETGYSIGICYPPGWNESHIMNLHPGDDTVLVPNMVFHLVPSLIIPELNGHVGFSDTVLVTEGGCEVLTEGAFGRELCVIDDARTEVPVA